jgi:hypothetical protein
MLAIYSAPLVRQVVLLCTSNTYSVNTLLFASSFSIIHCCQMSQVALVWVTTHGRSVIPKNKTECRINQNLEGDFKSSAEEVERMDSKMDKKLRFNNPSESFSWNFHNDLNGKK